MASTIEEDRFLRDLYVPLDPDESIRVTPTGDAPSLAGYANLTAAIEARAITTPGELVHRPTYGGGLQVAVETASTMSGRARTANTLRRNLLDDPRITEAVVNVAPGIPSDLTRRGAVTVSITATPRGDTAPISTSLTASE